MNFFIAAILKQSYKNLKMEKQYNLLLSLPVLIKKSLYLEKETKALQLFLEKFSEKEITQMLPLAIQRYCQSQQFDYEMTAQARRVLEKFKPHFLTYFKRFSNDFKLLGDKIETKYLQLEQTKKNIKNGKLYQCQYCDKSYHTANGLHYHTVTKHPRKQNVQSVHEKEQVLEPRVKKIKKPIKTVKRQIQSFFKNVSDEQD